MHPADQIDSVSPYRISLGYDRSFPPPPPPAPSTLLSPIPLSPPKSNFLEGCVAFNYDQRSTLFRQFEPKQGEINNCQSQYNFDKKFKQKIGKTNHNNIVSNLDFNNVYRNYNREVTLPQHVHEDSGRFLIFPGSPMYPTSLFAPPLKDQSPSGSSSGSNRSSTVSSNSSGYSGSCGQLPPHLKQHHRLSGQSTESGISTLSSQYACSPVTSSHSSLDKSDLGTSAFTHGGPQHAGRLSDPYHQGLKEAEALFLWLQEINLTDCYQLFLQSGYDKPTISRITPEDLTAIGITIPSVRKKLTTEISRLQIPDGIPNYWPSNLKEWLNLLHLQRYQDNLTKEGYRTLEDVLQITWEDLEEIGIKMLGHQKKIILAIDKLKKINSSKNLHPGASDELFDFTCTGIGVKSSKRSPVPCHKLIADQIAAKNKSKQDFSIRRSPEIIHLNPTAEIPAPEIVAIQVNRSWSVGQTEQERPLLKYESFHGSPSKDFRSLLKETSPDCSVFHSPTPAESRFYEPPPSPAPSLPLLSPVKMRPQVAPKPTCNRLRRASGGATVGISFEAEMLSNAVGLKRQNSCQGSILNQFSPICDVYRPADVFKQQPFYEGTTRSMTPSDSSRSKRSGPPAPPKRTNSIKSDLNTMADGDSLSPIKFSVTSNTAANREKENFSDVNSKLPPLARGLSRNWPVTQNKDNSHPVQNFISTKRSNSMDRSITDCNTLPFANENVGTIKQKISPAAESSVRDQHFAPVTNVSTSKDSPKGPPVKPKPKIPLGYKGSSPKKEQPPSTAELNCDSVFDDIDNMFQGLSKELDEMLIG